MSKSKARFLAELLSSDGKVIKTKSEASTIIVGDLPTIPNSKLANSSVTIAGSGLSLGASLTLDTGDITEHTNYKYYTDARADARIVNAGSANWNTAYTVANAALPKAGGAMTGAITTNSTFDGVDIATRDAVLTSTTTTAGAALPKAGGTMTGTLAMGANAITSTSTIDSGFITSPKITATASGMSSFATNLTNDEDWANSPISIRERGLAGAGDGENKDAPNINYHWSARISRSIWMESTGRFHIGEYDSTGVPQLTTGMSGLNVGNIDINNVTVIDASRVLTNLQGSLKSDTTFAFLTTADGAQNIRTRSVFAGTSYGDTPPAGSFNATNTYEQNGTTVIDSNKNLTNIGTISSGAITSSGKLYINQPSSDTNNELIIMRANDVYADQVWTDNSGSIRLRTENGRFDVFTGGAADSISASGATTRLSIAATGPFDFKTNNLTNIGTINSGAITSTGLLTSVGGVINTNTGSNALYITRLGNTNEALKIHCDDRGAVFESIQDETTDTYGNFIFAMDAGVAQPYFDVRKGTADSASKFTVNGSGKVGINIQAPVYTLDVRNPSDINQTFRVLYPDAATVEIGTSRMSSGATQGLFVNGQTLVKFGISGAEKMRVHTNGNVGIGTSSPAAGLQVSKGLTNAGGPAAGASTASACFGNDGSDDNYGLVLGADGNGLGYISAQRTDGTATAYPLVIQHTGGNVGIGTSAPGTSKLKVYNSTVSGNTRLHIHNDKSGDAAELRLEGKRTSSNDTGQLLFANNGNVVARIDAVSAGDDGALRFFTSATGTGDSVVQAMSISTAGVGTFVSDLVVNGKLGINENSLSSNARLQVRFDNAQSYNAYNALTNPSMIIKNLTSGASKFASLGFITEANGEGAISLVQGSGNINADMTFSLRSSGSRTEHLRITHDGKVGIGTAAPTAPLEVFSGEIANGANKGIRIVSNGAVKKYSIRTGITGAENTSFAIHDDTASANRLVISTAGNVGIGETVPQSKLHVKSGDSGGTIYDAGYNPLVIETPSHGGIQILTPNNRNGLIYFGDNDSPISGRIEYLHSTDTFEFVTGGASRLTLNNVGLSSTVKINAPSFIPSTGYNIEYLIVGGGGGGGTTIYDDAGGGGAGGYRSSIAGNPSANYAPPEPPLLAVVGKTYAVTVGAGGGQLGQGNSSGFGLIQSEGGGRAGNHRSRGHPGGSGGGGSGQYSAGDNVEGGVGYYGQGNNGGTMTNYSAAGGGGGAGAPGEGGSGSSKAGGAGVWSVVESGIELHFGSQTANRVYRAGGGGGYSAGAGGLGGGGRGWTTGTAPTAGAVNTGGGGGGNKENVSGSATVGGGSGIVILKVPTSNYTGTTTGSPTVTTVGSYKILKFTSSGSYTA